MQDDTTKQPAVANGKSIHQHVAGENEAQTKEKTKPLTQDSEQEDREEGDMKNGEIGAGFEKEE